MVSHRCLQWILHYSSCDFCQLVLALVHGYGRKNLLHSVPVGLDLLGPVFVLVLNPYPEKATVNFQAVDLVPETQCRRQQTPRHKAFPFPILVAEVYLGNGWSGLASVRHRRDDVLHVVIFLVGHFFGWREENENDALQRKATASPS